MSNKPSPGRVYEEGRARGTYIDEYGRELCDPTPIAPPIGYGQPPSLEAMVRTLVRSETLRQAAIAARKETFEESEDFDVDEDDDPTSPWENDFDPPLDELLAAGRAALAEKKAAPVEGDPPKPPKPPKPPAVAADSDE